MREQSDTRTRIQEVALELFTDHGYEATIVLADGPHVVCVYGINQGPGTNALLGCRST